MIRSLNLRVALTMAIAWIGWGGLNHWQSRVAEAEPKPERPAARATPKMRGAPDYTRLTGVVEGASLPTEEPEVLWKAAADPANLAGANVKDLGLTDVVVADGVVYFGDDKGQVYALAAEDGTEIWVHEHGARIADKPSVDKQHVYFTSNDRGLAAVRRATGELVWQHAIVHGTDVTPIPVGNRLYVSGYDGKSYAFDCQTGEVVWEHDFMEDAPPDQPGFDGKRARFQEIVARPGGAACDGKLFVQAVFDQSRIIALDCKTGKRHWTFQAAGWMSCDPTIAGDRVFAASQDSHLYCLDLATGNEVWKFKCPGWMQSVIAIDAGKVYLPYHKGTLQQLDADTGKLLQTFQSQEPGDDASLAGGAPLIANGTVFFTTNNGNLLALDIATWKLRWKLRPSDGSWLSSGPATDGRLIFVTASQAPDKRGESAVIAIGLRE